MNGNAASFNEGTAGPAPTEKSIAWVGGRVLPTAEARIPLDDRGFVFGESVYEAMLCRHDRLFAGHQHFARLERSAAGIGLEPTRFRADVERAVKDLLAANFGGIGLLYIQVTGGVAPREHVLNTQPDPVVVATLRSFDRLRLMREQEQGLTAITTADNRWALATYKSTQLLGSILGKRLAAMRGCDEVLFVDRDGQLVEGGSSNVFVVAKGRALTPPTSRNLLPGITRALLIERFPTLTGEAEIAASSLAESTEVFITSTAHPVVALTAIDGNKIGDGSIGPVTRELAGAFGAYMDQELGITSERSRL